MIAAAKRCHLSKTTMIEQDIQQRNLNKAYQQVCANKEAGGVDGMEISQLKTHLQTHSPGRAHPQWKLSAKPELKFFAAGL
jgi:hypothetical protein